MRTCLVVWSFSFAVLASLGCDSPAESTLDASVGPAVDARPMAVPDSASTPVADAAAQTGDDAGSNDYRYLCDLPPPPGAPLPPPPPAYDGVCPTLLPGVNTLVSNGESRSFILVFPQEIPVGERLPVVFLWHPLGTDADIFLREGELETAIESERFIAVLPEAKGDLSLQWPWSAADSEARVEEELRFFDDMFACVADQFEINESCVVNGGVSSGGLWATQVGWRRGEYFSSLLSVSGGSGDGTVVKPWQASPHKMPALVLWGGDQDICFYVFNFTDTSLALQSELAGDGHFLIECVHNCGHAVPPTEPAPGESAFSMFWNFGLNHPYWLEDGESPFEETGLPSAFPDWCAIGTGTATPRTGVCDQENQC